MDVKIAAQSGYSPFLRIGLEVSLRSSFVPNLSVS